MFVLYRLKSIFSFWKWKSPKSNLINGTLLESGRPKFKLNLIHREIRESPFDSQKQITFRAKSWSWRESFETRIWRIPEGVRKVWGEKDYLNIKRCRNQYEVINAFEVHEMFCSGTSLYGFTFWYQDWRAGFDTKWRPPEISGLFCYFLVAQIFSLNWWCVIWFAAKVPEVFVTLTLL